MSRTPREAALSSITAGSGWRLLKNLMGGAVILAIWLALWGWVLLGVMGPLAATRAAVPGTAAWIERA
jgi:hypothetical protein